MPASDHTAAKGYDVHALGWGSATDDLHSEPCEHDRKRGRPFDDDLDAGLIRKLLRPSFLDGLRKARTRLEQDLERESQGAAGRKQMARLPEVCVRFGQIRCFGLAEAKLFELIDPP
jgi:hypothetical protein